MKLIIIRHGEPDNPNQTLTEKGFEEVRALGEFYRDMKFDYAYTSPLARAKLTAEAVLKPMGKEAEVLPWLEEFSAEIVHPHQTEKTIPWDFSPSYFTSQNEFYENDRYLNHPLLQSGHVRELYEQTVSAFDDFMKCHGYKREGKYYRAVRANRDVVVLFCHFGMMAILMSRLMNIPYVLITQHFICPPTGVTVLYSEEREKGIAQFRCQSYGDISHLNAAHIEPSFHGRFCEIFDSDERH